MTEKSRVPDNSLIIRDRAITAWPKAWQRQNFRNILITFGYDVNVQWKDLPKKDRDWILYTNDKPRVTLYPGLNLDEVQLAIKQKREDYFWK